MVRRREDGRAVGTVQATVTDAGRRAEVAWVIGLPWQGRGLASRAARVMVDWLEHRGALRITAHVHPEHAASQRVARAVGLTPSDDFVDGERRWTNAPTARPHVRPQGRAGLGPASAAKAPSST